MSRTAVEPGIRDSLPSHWKLVELGEICEHNLGKMLDRQKNEGISRPYLRNPNVQWFKFDLTCVQTMPIKDNEREKYSLKYGDVVICEGGEAGRAAIWRGEVQEMYIQKALHRVRVGPELLNRYLVYVLMADAKSGYLRTYFTGATIPHFTGQDLHRYKIPLPPLSEQKRIADILDKADAIRRKRQEAIILAEQLIRSTFLKLFGDPIQNPMKWPVKKLREISTRINSGSTPKGGEAVYVPNGITFFRSQNVWRNRLELDDIAYIDEETHRKLSKSSLKHKDILITKTGRFNTENSSLGRAAIFLGTDDSANVNGHVYLVRLMPEAIHEYILYILTTDEYRAYIRSVCVGGIDKRQINKEHLEEFPIISPPRELQLRFAEIVKSAESHAARMRGSLSKSNSLFSSLQSRAFQGEL